MKLFLVFSALAAVTLAVPPVWYTGGECGVSKYPDAGSQPLPPPPNGRMVVGGVAARPWELPWQVSVRRKATNAHFCGGMIINEWWILTAGHCMDGEIPLIVSMVVGDHTRNDNSNTVRRHHDVQAIIIHEEYDDWNLYNDIALVKVSQPIEFNEDIQPICAPDPDNSYAHTRTVASGWGTLSSGGACCPQTLQYVSMNITTNEYCQNAYPFDDVSDDMICATDNTGSRERDTCQGDSGGPLTVQRENGAFEAVGVVSWGIGCASGYPGVYARVGHFVDWITDIITNN
jgi:trypsin